jgi:hypothetical protein
MDMEAGPQNGHTSQRCKARLFQRVSRANGSRGISRWPGDGEMELSSLVPPCKFGTSEDRDQDIDAGAELSITQRLESPLEG